jgi:hypothetical protein
MRRTGTGGNVILAREIELRINPFLFGITLYLGWGGRSSIRLLSLMSSISTKML